MDIYGALTVLNKLPVSYTEVSNILQQLMFSDEYATKAYVIDDILAQVRYLSNLILPAPALSSSYFRAISTGCYSSVKGYT